MGFLTPTPPDIKTRVCLRCLIFACLVFLGVELWSSTQGYTIRSYTQYTPRQVGAFCGLLLFIVSISSFKTARDLSSFGLLLGILAMLLALLPTMAYN